MVTLQLRAVAHGLDALVGRASGWDVSFLFAVAMAAFTILFGARRASATEHNRGIVLALAFESLVKLAALVAVGLYAVHVLSGDSSKALARAQSIIDTLPMPDYLAMVGLGMLAAFTLPHQFHVEVVELRDPVHLRIARWLFSFDLVDHGRQPLVRPEHGAWCNDLSRCIKRPSAPGACVSPRRHRGGIRYGMDLQPGDGGGGGSGRLRVGIV